MISIRMGQSLRYTRLKTIITVFVKIRIVLILRFIRDVLSRIVIKLNYGALLFSCAAESFQPVVETHQAVAGTKIV